MQHHVLDPPLQTAHIKSCIALYMEGHKIASFYKWFPIENTANILPPTSSIIYRRLFAHRDNQKPSVTKMRSCRVNVRSDS